MDLFSISRINAIRMVAARRAGFDLLGALMSFGRLSTELFYGLTVDLVNDGSGFQGHLQDLSMVTKIILVMLAVFLLSRINPIYRLTLALVRLAVATVKSVYTWAWTFYINLKNRRMYHKWHDDCAIAFKAEDPNDRLPELPTAIASTHWPTLACRPFVNFTGCKCHLRTLLQAEGKASYFENLAAEKRRWDGAQSIFHKRCKVNRHCVLHLQARELASTIDALIREYH